MTEEIIIVPKLISYFVVLILLWNNFLNGEILNGPLDFKVRGVAGKPKVRAGTVFSNLSEARGHNGAFLRFRWSTEELYGKADKVQNDDE